MKRTVWLWSIKYTSCFLCEDLLNLVELIQTLLSHAEAAQVMIQMVSGTGFPYAQTTMRVLTPAESLGLWKPHEVLMIPGFLPCYGWRRRYSIRRHGRVKHEVQVQFIFYGLKHDWFLCPVRPNKSVSSIESGAWGKSKRSSETVRANHNKLFDITTLSGSSAPELFKVL